LYDAGSSFTRTSEETGMKGALLRFYVHENRKHEHVLLYEWLLERARGLGIAGGSAFRALAGFGRHGVLREEHFYELAGDVPVGIDFALSDAQADEMLALIRAEGIRIFYLRIPIEFSSIEGNT
jgi:PII-like signaling protein